MQKNSAREMTSEQPLLLCSRPCETVSKPAHFTAGWLTSSLEPLGFSRLRAHPESRKDPLPAQFEYKKLLGELRLSVLAREKQSLERDSKRNRRMKIVRLYCERQRAAVRELLRGKAEKEELNKVFEPSTEPPKEVAEEDAALLDFAEKLDFERFMDDMQFRTTLGILKDRAGVLEKEQNALFEDLADAVNAEISKPKKLEDLPVAQLEMRAPQSSRSTRSIAHSLLVTEPTTTAPPACDDLAKKLRESSSVHSSTSARMAVAHVLSEICVPLVNETEPRSKQQLGFLPYQYRCPSL